jgi:hypothetical protein
MSQCSPSSDDVVSVSSGSWPWKRMRRCWCRNFKASNDTPGKIVRVASAGSGQAFDQSERIITTDPAGILPFLASHRSMSAT